MRIIKRRYSKLTPYHKEIVRHSKRSKVKERVDFLSSGCITLNLALSGKGLNGGWARGRVVNIVGDGSSGKTLLALELAFWCYKNIKKVKSEIFPKVKKLIVVYNNAEGVMDFPLEKMYGEDFAKFIQWKNTKNVERMGRDYVKRLNSLKKGECLIYIVDTWDALGSAAGSKRFEDSIEDEKEIKGSYHLEKQKYANLFFDNVCSRMGHNEKDATLFIVSQVKTKIGMAFGKKTYRGGGKALDFYTHQVAWIRELKRIEKSIRKEKRVYAIRSGVKVERSKVGKPFRESNFWILYDYGLDNLSSQIEFLWGTKKGTVKKIKFKGKQFKSKERFVKYIEQNNLEEELAKKTEKKWQRVERSFEKEVEKRKKRH